MDQKSLERYIERVTEVRRRAQGRLDPKTLREIALDVGISEEELAEADEVAALHEERGDGFLRHGRSGDAVNEYTEALAIRPGDDQLRLKLATAMVQEWEGPPQGSRDKEMQRAAEALVRETLERDPGLEEAYQLLNRLESNPREQVPKRNMPAAGAVLAVCLFVIGAGAYSLSASDETEREEVPKAAMVMETLASPISTVTKTPVEPEAGELIAGSDPEFPIRWGNSESSAGLTARLHQANHNVYGERAFLEVNGWIRNEGEHEWSRMQAEIQLVDKQGRLLGLPHQIEIVQVHNVPLRPGDQATFYTTMQSSPSAAGAILTVLPGERVPASSTYPPARKIEFVVTPQLAASASRLTLQERSADFQNFEILNSRSFRGEFEIFNEGPAIRHLKISIEMLDKQGQLLEGNESLVAFSSSAPILEGETRLYGTVRQVPKGAVDYRIRIVELR